MLKKEFRKIQIIFRVSAAFIILSLMAIAITGRLLPGLQDSAGLMVKSHISNIMSENIKDILPVSLAYDDAVIMSRNEDDSLNSAELNMARLNILSGLIGEGLEEKLKIPENKMIRMQKFYTIEIQQMGSIETKYVSEFLQEDINRTRHNIYLEVSMDISYKGFLLNGSTTVSSIFPVAEAYISN